MKLIWHIIKKDVRSHLGMLLFWGLLFVAQIVLGLVAQGEDGAELETVNFLQQLNVVIVALQFATGYILVARFVQVDELTGTRMFWATRPISATRLLAAKVIGVGMFFALLPVLLLLPWWLYNGFGVREILWTSLDMLGWQLLMIAPAFLLASLTADLGRVLMWTLVIVTGLVAGVIILQSELGIAFGDSYRSSRVGVFFTRLWLADVVLVTGASAIAVHQFLTRRSVRSVGLTGALLGLVVLVGSIGWVDWSRAFDAASLARSVAAEPGLAEGVTYSVETAEEATYPPRPNGRETDREIRVRFRARGLPEGMKLFNDRIEHNWLWVDSLNFNRVSAGHSGGDPDYKMLRTTLGLREPTVDPETSQWQQARFEKANAERIARGQPPFRRFGGPEPESDGVPLSVGIWLPSSILARMRTEPPVYTATLLGLIARPQLVVELPIKPGARGAGDSQTFHVLQQADNKVVLISTIPSVKKTGLWQVLMGKRSGSRDYFFRDRLLLVNRVTGDINGVSRDYSSSPRSVVVGGVVIGWDALTFYPSSVKRGDRWLRQDPQWLDHSSLVLLTNQQVARFTREVKLDRFQVKRSATDEAVTDGPY